MTSGIAGKGAPTPWVDSRPSRVQLAVVVGGRDLGEQLARAAGDGGAAVAAGHRPAVAVAPDHDEVPPGPQHGQLALPWADSIRTARSASPLRPLLDQGLATRSTTRTGVPWGSVGGRPGTFTVMMSDSPSCMAMTCTAHSGSPVAWSTLGRLVS